jgi:Penicillin-insensitive murein endopeptidase
LLRYVGSPMSARAHALACCPACAASVGPRGLARVVPIRRAVERRRARPRVRHWGWAAVLVLLAALVPLAALDGPGADTAVAVAAPSTRPQPIPPAPPPIAESTDEVVVPHVVWRDSIAHGSPNDGWLENGVLLPVRGPGYYTYNPDTQEPPGGPLRRWGTARLVREVLTVAAWWADAHPDAPRLGVGDLALKGGGPFTSDHASHQNGLDVDIRLPRADGVEGPASPATYDRALTQQLVDHLVAQGATLVLIGPSLDLTGPAGVVVRWPNHDDHLHVRFPDPDGAN